jgi:hypothetical protein
VAVGILFVAILIILGAPAYGRDVDFIESEMVVTARWVESNIDSDTVIAAHDIGALGYFAPHRLVDLAGLISPDVIPVMNDSRELARFILESDAEYLIAFPNWSNAYEEILASPHFCPVWSSAEVEAYKQPTPLGPLTVYQISREADCLKMPQAMHEH